MRLLIQPELKVLLHELGHFSSTCFCRLKPGPFQRIANSVRKGRAGSPYDLKALHVHSALFIHDEAREHLSFNAARPLNFRIYRGTVGAKCPYFPVHLELGQRTGATFAAAYFRTVS
jgi:hypothetical protein